MNAQDITTTAVVLAVLFGLMDGWLLLEFWSLRHQVQTLRKQLNFCRRERKEIIASYQEER